MVVKVELPASFPSGTDFIVVDDEIPVTFTPDGVCTAWDTPGGRPFAITSTWSGRGRKTDEASFREFVKSQPLAFNNPGA
jgi:hypothetical protein